MEFFHNERRKGMKVLRAPADPYRTRCHTVENSALERCFFGERDKKSYANRREGIIECRRAAYHAQDLVQVNAERRDTYAKKQAALGRTVRRWPELAPPCGGDCQNCPYDGECHYESWDQSAERRRLKNKRKKEKKKADPKKREAYRQSQRKSGYKKRFLKNGGTAEEFAAMWSEAGGDVEQFKRIRDMRIKEGTSMENVKNRVLVAADSEEA